MTTDPITTAREALIALDYMLVACGLSPKMGDGTPCYDLIHKHINVASVATETLRTERDELRNMWDIQQDALEEKWQVAASEQEAIAQAENIHLKSELEKLKAERDAFAQSYADCAGPLASMANEITRLTSQLEQAEKVIAPFAETAIWAESNGHDIADFDMLLRGPGDTICGHLQAQQEDFAGASQWIKDRQAKTDAAIGDK